MQKIEKIEKPNKWIIIVIIMNLLKAYVYLEILICANSQANIYVIKSIASRKKSMFSCWKCLFGWIWASLAHIHAEMSKWLKMDIEWKHRHERSLLLWDYVLQRFCPFTFCWGKMQAESELGRDLCDYCACRAINSTLSDLWRCISSSFFLGTSHVTLR